MMGAADTSTVLDPEQRVGGKLVARALHPIFGWYPNQKTNASYVSECEIGKSSENGGPIVRGSPRHEPATYSARYKEGSFLSECVEGKVSRNERLWPLAA